MVMADMSRKKNQPRANPQGCILIVPMDRRKRDGRDDEGTRDNSRDCLSWICGSGRPLILSRLWMQPAHRMSPFAREETLCGVRAFRL